jgi:hypothetical protein
MMEEDRIVIRIGEEGYAVIAGRRLNDAPLSKVEADRLAAAEGAPAVPESAYAPAPAESAPPGRVYGPDGQYWDLPPPNSPAQAKPGWLTKQQMDAVNNKPLAAAALQLHPWGAAGGKEGFAINGIDPNAPRPRGYLRANGKWQPLVEPGDEPQSEGELK